MITYLMQSFRFFLNIAFALLFLVYANRVYACLPEDETSCEIAGFYEGVEPDSDVKVLTQSGNVEEAELILVPTQLETGVYEIQLTRKDQNLYKVETTAYYIETRYCYEYASYQEAILKVESNYGYNKGTLYFD